MPDAMGPYLPLLRIDAEHAYFADGQCRGLRFVPTDATQALLQAAGCVVRENGTALVAFGHRQAFSGLQAPGDAPPALVWQLRAGDEGFAAYTEGFARLPGELLHFDAADAVFDAQHDRWCLHAGDTASAADVRPLTWPLVAQALDAAARRVPPCALVRVPLGTLSQVPLRLRLRFAARATVWKYCLFGSWSEPQLQVVDLAREAEFTEPAVEQLDGGLPMLAIRSRERIAVRQRSERRFQLRSRHGGGDKVLIKRLPVAGARQLGREEIDGVSTLVSEIHVHR